LRLVETRNDGDMIFKLIHNPSLMDDGEEPKPNARCACNANVSLAMIRAHGVFPNSDGLDRIGR
jgi:hypothetical protein